MTDFARAEEGQAIVVVGLAMMLLLGALALAVDWGYGYAARRDIQTGVDAAALAASRRLSTTFTLAGGVPAFEATVEDVCDEVRQRTAGIRGTVQLALFSGAGLTDPSTWTSVDTTDCAAGAGTAPPGDVIFVRVSATTTYASLFSVATGQTIAAGATALARLTAGEAIRALRLPAIEGAGRPGVGVSGLATAPNVAIWPIAVHIAAAGLPTSACGEYCTDSRRVLTLFPAPSPQRFGSFHGLVTLSHESLRTPSHQIITESDYRGSTHLGGSTPPLPNKSDPRVCGGATWDSAGSTNMAAAVNCDLPNWLYYGYGGSIGVGTNWGDPSWSDYLVGAEPPTRLQASRASCGAPSYFVMPSCPGGTGTTQFGDWIETVTQGSGEPTANMAHRMLDFIDRYGRDDARSATLGKGVVVYVPLWDCAERYRASAPSGARWNLLLPTTGSDCSLLRGADDGGVSPDRVHVLTAVPFTFYENLISCADCPVVSGSVTVKAYWGGTFGDAGSCGVDASPAACALDPVINSAFLVSDE